MQQWHERFLSIAGITLRIDTDRDLEMAEEFRPFLTSKLEADFTARFQQIESLPDIPEQILYESNCYRVHPDGKGGYFRSFFDAPRDRTPYGVAQFQEDGTFLIQYLKKGAGCVSQMHNSFFHLGFENLLIRKQRICLHAACVDTPLGGILFSGPSGIGKSTQAQLWHEHRGAVYINGDRPILSRESDHWLAWGSPYAGSSKCHVNACCLIRAIVMLRQAQTCSIRRLTEPEAFRAVWSGLTMYSWDEQFVIAASDLTMELIKEVPVYEFCCTPDAAAVEYLEAALRKEFCL